MNNEERNSYVRQQLKETLIQLMSEQDLATITVSTLCNRAQIGRASFYRNYKDKEDIIREYSDDLIKKWGYDFENDASASPSTVFGSLFTHYKENAAFYTLLYENGLSEIILDTIKKTVNLSDELPNEEAYTKAFFAYGMYGWICEWIHRSMTESGDEINAMLAAHNK